MTEAHGLPPGTVLIDEYEIISVLGAGRLWHHLSGQVSQSGYAATRSKNTIRAAGATVTPRALLAPNLHMMRTSLSGGLRRFLEEAQRIAKFSHHNIVRVDRYFPANGTAYMVPQL